MTTIPRIRINGPLVPFVGRVWSHLLAQGYRPRTSKNLLHLVSHLSRWLVAAGLRLSDLTRESIEAFFGDRRQAGYKSSSHTVVAQTDIAVSGGRRRCVDSGSSGDAQHGRRALG